MSHLLMLNRRSHDGYDLNSMLSDEERAALDKQLKEISWEF